MNNPSYLERIVRRWTWRMGEAVRNSVRSQETWQDAPNKHREELDKEDREHRDRLKGYRLDGFPNIICHSISELEKSIPRTQAIIRANRARRGNG